MDLAQELKIMKPIRERIDSLDEEIVKLLAMRTDIIREAAALKYEHGIAAILQYRVDEVRENAAKTAAEHNMDPDVVREIYTKLITYSCALEESLIKDFKVEHSIKV